MDIDLNKIEADVLNFFKSDEIRSEKTPEGISKAIVYAIKKYHEELNGAHSNNNSKQ